MGRWVGGSVVGGSVVGRFNKTLRKDRDRFGRGPMFYVNEQIPSKVLSLESIPMEIELILLGQLSCQYDKTVLIGDFNLMINNESLENVMTTFDLECLIKKPTCFQSSNPTCIDLVLTNKKDFFKNTGVIEVGISDHHSLILTALKSLLLKGNAKTKLYRDYSSFNMDHFKEDLDNNLINNSITEYSHFQNIFLEILDKHAPIKKRY